MLGKRLIRNNSTSFKNEMAFILNIGMIFGKAFVLNFNRMVKDVEISKKIMSEFSISPMARLSGCRTISF